MSGHQQRHTFGGGHIEQKFKDGCAGVFVEGAGRLVGEQDFRVVHQGAAERGALTFAAGKLLNTLIETMAQTGAIGELVQALLWRARDRFRRRPWG